MFKRSLVNCTLNLKKITLSNDQVSFFSKGGGVTNPPNIIIACARHGVKPAVVKLCLLFLVTCMHDAMQATCTLCAVWRTRDTVICGTE